MKENKQSSKKQWKLFQALKPGTPILQRLVEEKPSYRKMLKSLLSILFLPICIVFCYVLSILFIGDGAYGYSENLYAMIEQAIESHAITTDKFQVGVFEDSSSTEATAENVETANMQIEDNISKEDIQLGIDSLGIYEQYKQAGLKGKVCVNLEPNNSYVVSSIKNGFFEAEVTRNLADDLSTMEEPERNFNSLGQYMIHFWFIFGLCFIIGGIALWFISEAVIYGILRFIFWVATKKIANTKHPSNNTNPAIPQEQISNTTLQSSPQGHLEQVVPQL